jgi:hypothetical protein
VTYRPLAATLLLLAVGCGSDDSNLAPETVPDEATTLEDTPITVPVLDNDTDPDDDRLTTRITQQPPSTRGVVTRDGDSLVFTPAQDFNGDVEFDYKVFDGTDSSNARLTVHVTAVNDAPVAVAQTLEAGRNEPTFVRLGAVDIDDDFLTYEIVEPPAHGTLTGAPPELLYTPAQGYSGADSFRFVARDRELASAEAAVSVQIAASTRPEATWQTLSANEDVPLDLTLAGTDADEDALTFAVITPPAHGTLSGTGANLTYTPAANFHGYDYVYFTASDGTLTSTAARIDINVASVPDAPVANAINLTGSEDVTISFALAASDVDGDSLSSMIVDAPDHGQVTCSWNETCTYLGVSNYHGTDSFTYTISDGTTTTAAATVSISLAPVADKPQAQGGVRQAVEDTALAITLTALDPDGNPTTFTHGNPGQGTLTGDGANLVYTPPANYNGTTSFTFTASDDAGSSNATITLQVGAVNDAPTAAAANLAVTEDAPTAITLGGSDIDSTNLIYSIVTPPSAGTITGNGAAKTYVPSKDRNGPDTFVYQVSDGQLSASATITVAIAPVADAPRPVRDIVQLSGAETIDVVGNDEDPDGDAVELASVAAAAHGTATQDGDEVQYTPAAGFTGTDTFTYTVTDPGDLVGTATVYVGVGMFPTGIPLLAIAQAASNQTLSWDADLSADGRYVALVTQAKLVPGDQQQFADVYVYDRLEGTFELISTRPDGSAAGGARMPSISDDGRYVAFLAQGGGIVANDTSSTSIFDVYVRDRVSGTTVLASVSTGGTQATSISATQLALSGDGRHVAFTTRAFELVAGDANASPDVFVRDLDSSVTERVSVTATGGELDIGVESGEGIAIDQDGSAVAFVSAASEIVADGGTGQGVFVRNRTAGTVIRVSRSTSGTPANGASMSPALSADGSVVAFVSSASNLIPNDINNDDDVFVHVVGTGTTYRSPLVGAPAKGVTISADGRYLAGWFDTATTDACVVTDRISGLSRNLNLRPDGSFPTTGLVGRCTIAANGRYAAYVSSVPDIGEDPHPAGDFTYVAPISF